MINTRDSSDENKGIVRAYEETKEEVIVAQIISKLDEIKLLKYKIYDSVIYVAGSEEILPKITEWDMNILETIIQEIDSCEESADRQIETGSIISYSSGISKKISDEEILLAFQQKYSYLSDSSNM